MHAGRTVPNKPQNESRSVKRQGAGTSEEASKGKQKSARSRMQIGRNGNVIELEGEISLTHGSIMNARLGMESLHKQLMQRNFAPRAGGSSSSTTGLASNNVFAN